MSDKLTNSSHDLSLLSVLVLVSSCNPGSARGERCAADTREHIPGGHYQRRDDGAHSPCPPVAQERRNEREGEQEEQGKGTKGAPAGPVDRRLVGNRHGCVGGELFSERARFKAAVDGVRMKRRVK